MKKYLSLIALLFASVVHAQSAPVLVTPEGGVAGTQPTQAQLNAGILGTPGSGAFNGGSGCANLITVTGTNTPSFPAPTLIGGTPQSNNGTKVWQFTTVNPPTGCNFQYVFRSGSKANASVGFPACIDFDQSVKGGQYSLDSITANGGSTQNLLLGPNPSPGGISLETGGSFSTGAAVPWHGSNCLTDPTFSSWRWITIGYAQSGTNLNRMNLYDITGTTLLGSWFGPTTGTALNPGSAQFFLTGNESEAICTPACHIYVKGKMIDDVNGVFPLLPATTAAPLWSGILAPARATDWTTAGVVGGIPSASWTQFTSIAAYTGTAAAINTALSSCGANQYVLLGGGTFTLSTGIFSQKANCELRLSSSTILAFTNAVTTVCGNAFVCFDSTGAPNNFPPPTTIHNWTAGFSVGTTQITLDSVSGLSVGNVIVLTQCEDGTTGNPTCSGTVADAGLLFNCSVQYVSASSGCSFDGPDGGLGWSNGSGPGHEEQEMFTVTNISGLNVTLDHAIINPNWATARSPVVWFFTPLLNVGMQGGTIDGSAVRNLGQSGTGVKFVGTSNFWLHGTKINFGPVLHVWNIYAVHGTIEQNYSYQSVNPSNVSHMIDDTVTSDMLIQANICQQINTCFHIGEGPDNRTVVGYNFQVNSASANDNMLPALRSHSNGDNFILLEGNIFEDPILLDDTHGSEWMITPFRNFLPGWESCATTGNCGANPATVKDFGTNCMEIDSYNRYMNVVGNVCGTPNFHNTYITANNSQNKVEFIIGSGNGAASPPVPNDSLVQPSTMLWGNYDVFNAAVRFVAGENGSGAPGFPALASPSSTLPASFYLSAKPSWFQSIPWPPIGPDVANSFPTAVGQCSGSLNVAGKFNGLPTLSAGQCAGSSFTTAWGQHVNANPAMICAINVMGMPLDGTGPALPFDANSCYSPSGTPTANTPTANPTGGTYGLSQSVSLSVAGGAPVICYTTNGTTPATNGVSACTTGTLYASAIAVASTLNLQAIAGGTGFLDGSVATFSYVILNAAPGVQLFGFTALPLPSPPTLPSLTLTPTQGGSSYVTAQGLSQNGANWSASDPVRLIGTGFAQNSTVTFDTNPLPLTFVSPTEVDVTLPASMVLLPLNPASHTFTVSTPVQPPPPAIALLQKASKDAGTMTSTTLPFASATKQGDWIGVAVRLGLPVVSGLKVIDSQGNVFKLAVSSPQSKDGSCEAIYYAENIKGGAETITVTNTTLATLRLAILEYSGISQSGSLDATASAQGVSSTTLSSGTITPSVSGDLILGEFLTANAASFTPSSGFTVESVAGAKLMVEDMVQAKAAPLSAGATIGAADNWSGAVAAFKP